MNSCLGSCVQPPSTTLLCTLSVISMSQLNQMCDGMKPDLGDVKGESVRKTVKAIVDLLHQSEESLSLIIATHLIISAMDRKASIFENILNLKNIL